MAEELKIVVRADTRQAVSGMKRLTTSSKIAMAAIGAAAIAIGTKAVKAATSFGRAMAEVSTITDDSKQETRALTEQIKDMSVAMGTDATQTAKGLYQTISAGVTDSADRMKFLTVATKLSIAGLANQESTVKVLAAVMNAYGMTIEDAAGISDTLFQTVRLGVVKVEDLASSLGSVIPIAAAANISFEEISAAMAVLTKGGLGAERASTALRASITAMLQPSNKMTAAAKDAGFEIGREALAGKGLSGVLESLAKLEAKDSEATLKLFESKRALVGMLRLGKDGAREFNDAMGGMEKKVGATDTAFRKMNESAGRQQDMFRSKLNRTMIEFGEEILPFVGGAMNAAGGELDILTGKFGALNTNVEQSTKDAEEFTKSMITLGKVLLTPLTLLFKLGGLLDKIFIPKAGGLMAQGIFAQRGGPDAPTPLAFRTPGMRQFFGVGTEDAEGSIAARAAARGITGGGDRPITINTGPNYVQTKDPRDRLEDGAFSGKVAS